MSSVSQVQPKHAVDDTVQHARQLVGAQVHFVSSIVTAGLYCVCRLGTEATDWASACVCLLASWTLLGVPNGRTSAVDAPQVFGVVTKWFLGTVLGATGLYVSALVFGDSRVCVAIFGLIQVALLMRSMKSFKKAAGLLVIVVGLTLFSCSVFWSSGYVSPLLGELLLRGEIYEDVVMNISISEMVRGYHSASTGLHGLPYFGYHWGAHAFLGLSANCLAIPVSLCYSLLFPLVIIPLLLRFLVLSAAACAPWVFESSLTQYGLGMVLMLLAVWPAAILCYSGGLPPGMQYVIPYISESLLASVVISLIVVCLFSELMRARGWSAAVPGMAVLVAAGLVIVCKVTTGFALVAWLCLSTGWVSIARRDWTMAFFLCVVSVGSAALVGTVFAGEGILRARSAYAVAMFVLRFAFVRNLFFYTLPALIVALMLPSGGLGEVIRFRSKTITWHVSGTVAALLTYVICPVPAVMFSFSDDEKYFLWAPVFLCSSWMLAGCAALWNRFSVRDRFAVGIVLSVTLCAAVSNEGLDLASDIRRATGRQVDIAGPRVRLLTLLADIGRGVPVPDRKQVCLFIDSNARTSALRENSLTDLFLPCAVSGLAQVYGNPVEGSAQSGISTFSMNCYRDRSPVDPDLSQLKLECQRLGFNRVVFVTQSLTQFKANWIDVEPVTGQM